MNYDVFISYRRKTGADDARLLQQALKARGYHVFFDYDSVRNGEFDERIFSAIDEAPIFILMLSKGALDNCISEKDWVRIEIEYAIRKRRRIVPVSAAVKSWRFPADLPKSLQHITRIQISEINKASLFEESIDRIVKDRLSTEGAVKGYLELTVYDKCVAFARKAFAYKTGAMPRGLSIGGDISDGERENACMNMNVKTGAQSIVGLWNCAWWDYGKYGFAFTVEGLYVRNKGMPPVYILWKNLANCSVINQDRYFIMAERGFSFNGHCCTSIVSNDTDFTDGQRIRDGVWEFAKWIKTQGF